MNKSRIFYKVLSFVFVIISMSLVYSFDSEDDSVIEPKPSPTPIEGVYKGEYFVDNTNGSDSNHTLWINEVVPSGKHFSDQNYIYNNTIFIDENYSTAIDMDGTNTHIYNNIFYAINGANIGGKQLVVKNNDTPLNMQNNLFFGEINSNFIEMDSNTKDGDPLFNKEGSGTKFGYQLKTGSAAINAGIAKQGPPIPGAGSEYLKT